jgi:hypothetical protein
MQEYHQSSIISNSEFIANTMDTVIEKLQDSDFVSAHIMVGAVRAMLDNLYVEIEQHSKTEIALMKTLLSLKNDAP